MAMVPMQGHAGPEGCVDFRVGWDKVGCLRVESLYECRGGWDGDTLCAIGGMACSIGGKRVRCHGDDAVFGFLLTLLYVCACAAWYNGMLLILEFVEWMDQYLL